MKQNKEAIVYFTKLDFSHPFREEELLLQTPALREKKIRSFFKIEDKVRGVFVWKLLEKAIKDLFSLDINKETITQDYYGKPSIANKKNIYFNLTHSGEIAACIVDSCPVGIDVEHIVPVDLSIASNFFSKKEVKDLFDLPEFEQDNYFFKLWTLKESYIKAEGKGLSIPLDTFSFKISDYSLEFEGKNSHIWDFSLHNININDQKYYLGVCVNKNRLPKKIIEIKMRELFRKREY